MRALSTNLLVVCALAAGCTVFPDRVELPAVAGSGGNGAGGALTGGSAAAAPDASTSCPIHTVVVGAVADTYISADYSDVNYGTDPKMNVGKSRGQLGQRLLVNFDLPTVLASGQNVVAVRVDLTVVNPASADANLALYPVTIAWRETQATWLAASSQSDWTTAGGDYGATPTASASVPRTVVAGDEVEWTIPLVRKPLTANSMSALTSTDSGAAYGWLVAGVDPSADVPEITFATREGLADTAPRLEVDVASCQ